MRIKPNVSVLDGVVCSIQLYGASVRPSHHEGHIQVVDMCSGKCVALDGKVALDGLSVAQWIKSLIPNITKW